ncbi:MAG: hypothetical protein ABIA97_04470 [Candidatus Omnitrophota bacterium]
MQIKTKRIIAREWLIFWGMLFAGMIIRFLLKVIHFWFNMGITVFVTVILYIVFSFIRSFIWAIRTLKQKA